jgi:hypothetical protein
MGPPAVQGHPHCMTPPDPLRDPASALVEAAQAFDRAAHTRGSHRAAPDSLSSLQDALQALTAAWYRLAADAGASMSRGDLSREQEVTLIGAMHDMAAAFARCARACREGHSRIAPVIAKRMPADPDGYGRVDDDRSWFASRQPTTGMRDMSSAGATSGSGEEAPK